MVGGFCNYQNVLNHTEGRLKCIVSKTLATFEIPFYSWIFSDDLYSFFIQWPSITPILSRKSNFYKIF
jgi:hypothetical protein